MVERGLGTRSRTFTCRLDVSHQTSAKDERSTELRGGVHGSRLPCLGMIGRLLSGKLFLAGKSEVMSTIPTLSQFSNET